MTGRMKRAQGTLSPAERTRKLAELLGREFSAHHADENGWTDLHHAVVLGDLALARHLLDHGAAVNARLRRDGERWSYRLTRMLRECGYIERSHRGYRDGEVPLHFAARSDDCEMAELLIAHGANVKAPAADGGTALHAAAGSNAHETAVLLTAGGADVDAKDDQGETPLHEAAYGDARETAEFLIANGANVHATNDQGETPLHFAARGGARNLVELLMSHGAKVVP